MFMLAIECDQTCCCRRASLCRAITWGGKFCHREMSEKDTLDKTVSRRYTEGRVHIKVRKYLWGVVWNLTRHHSVYVDLQGILERENKTA